MFHIRPRDGAGFTGAMDRAGVHAQPVRQMPHRRRDRGTGRGRGCFRSLRLDRGGFRRRPRRGRLMNRCPHLGGGLGDPGQRGSHWNGFADAHQEICHDALLEGLHIHDGLVRVHDCHKVAAAHVVTGLDEPFDQLAVLHVSPERGHEEVTHRCPPWPWRRRRSVLRKAGRPARGAWRRGSAPRRCRPGPPARRGQRTPAR